MGAVLVPVLLQSMALHDNNKWSLYASLSSVLWIPQESTQQRLALTAVGLAAAAAVYHPRTLVVLCTLFFWNITEYSICWFPSLHQVFTRGEWTLITSLFTIAVTEFLMAFISNDATMSHHNLVALTGVLACLVACGVTVNVQNVWMRASLLVLIPLVAVEAALTWRWKETLTFPRAATWLLRFLFETEQSNTLYISSYPRYVWLLYWMVVLVLALVCSPRPQHTRVVVVRKYFHGMAILLFVPVTVVAPLLMSLSYAIALSILMVMEQLQPFLPTACQEFYARYLDPQKDNGTAVVVSHMALILGCALPLWLYECVVNDEDSTPRPIAQLLPLFGVMVLGVGDSLGALVGTYCGKLKWPVDNVSRTLEGSAAMWLGMAGIYWMQGISIQYWLPAVTFTTLLEALTMQIDNLVLPLAGAAIVLLSTATS